MKEYVNGDFGASAAGAASFVLPSAMATDVMARMLVAAPRTAAKGFCKSKVVLRVLIGNAKSDLIGPSC